MKAKDSNAKLTDQQLAENLAEKNEAGGELSEAELESVAGGCLELDDGTTYGSGCS